MDGNIIGLVAVTLFFGIPLGAMYTYYRVRKLRTEERLAAIARGVNVPMEPDLSEAARSRRWGILLAATSLGYVAMMALIALGHPAKNAKWVITSINSSSCSPLSNALSR